MKRLLILLALLTLMIPEGRLFATPAISPSSFSDWIIQNIWRRMQGRDPSIPGRRELSPGLPAGCREEACHSVPDPIAGLANCHRIICGGNFWGESATDVMCDGTSVTQGTGDNQRVYNVCQIRFPKREYSNDPWIPVRFQTSGPSMKIDNPWQMKQLKSVGGLKSAASLRNWILPELYAEDEMPWSPAARQAVANALDEALARLMQARDQQNFDMIGAPGTEFRAYVDYTEQVLRWTLHALEPDQYACPGPCSEGPSPNFFINDEYASDGSLGETGQMDEVFVDRTYGSFDTDPGLLAIQALVTAHEVAHVFNHLLGPPFANQYNPSSLRFTTGDEDLEYADETTAQQVGVITYAFLSDDVRAALPDDPNKPVAEPIINDFWRTYQFGLLQQSNVGSMVRIFPLGDSYAGQFFWNGLGNGYVRAWVAAQAGSPDPNKIGHWLNSNPAYKTGYLNQLESKFLGRDGGFRGMFRDAFSGDGRAGEAEVTSALHIDHLRSDLTNPPHSGPGTPPGGTVGNPPGSRASPDPNIGNRPNLPGYTPPDLSNRVPSNIATRQNPGDVAAWCRSHPGGACNPPPPPSPPPPGTPSDGGGGGGTGSGSGGEGGGYPCTDCPPSGGDGGWDGGAGGPFHEGEGSGNGDEGEGDGPHGEVFIPPD